MRLDLAHFRIAPLTVPAVASIAWRMRAEDWREITAMVALEDPDLWAERIVPVTRFGAVATWREIPAAALGAVEARPGVFSLWMFATADWPSVALGVTLWCRRVLERELLAAGAHRVECQSIAEHQVAHAWLRQFGLTPESWMPGFGKRGETFITFARVADHVLVDAERAAPAATAAAPSAAAAPAG